MLLIVVHKVHRPFRTRDPFNCAINSTDLLSMDVVHKHDLKWSDSCKCSVLSVADHIRSEVTLVLGPLNMITLRMSWDLLHILL